jgi:hypothetical protein
MNACRLLPIPLALLLTACTIDMRTGPTERDSVSIARDSSEFLSVNLNMGAGNLNVGPGADAAKFADGELIYNIEAWKPTVKYRAAAGHGSLEIAQPSSHTSHAGNMKYEWNLRLTEREPIDLTARFGAGEARLDLGRLTLRSVDVTMGAGELDMDLRGAPERSYEVRVRGGVGEATIRLPRDIGVSAKAVGGIGAVNAPRLRKEGDHYVNDAYQRSKATIHLDIQGGIGQINLLD